MENLYALMESDFFNFREGLKSRELKEKFRRLKEFCLYLKNDEKECFEHFQNFYQRLMRKGLRLLVSQYTFRSD